MKERTTGHRQIELLSKETIDQIAAGEVVERPSSVVKELVENAIDAGADAVTVEIREGGKRLIRVTDNGAGIPADQIQKAFLRHATSKIRQADDLTALTSLGFRGEALSSIAAVAQVECITKTAEALTGTRYAIEGGQETACEEVGAPDGTTFLVHNLFYNTPVREKFMKSAAAEGSQVRGVVESLALSHPQIAFTFLQEGRTGLVTDGRGDIRSVIYQIYGRETAKNLIPFETEDAGIHVSGFLGTAAAARGNRAGELFFVNGRFVKDDMLTRAAEDGYHGYLMQHRYPFLLLYLEIDGTLVDVNVHPTKREVRFSDGDRLYRMLCLGIQNTLLAGEHILEATAGPEERKTEKRTQTALPGMETTGMPEPFEAKRRAEIFGWGSIASDNGLIPEKAEADHAGAGTEESLPLTRDEQKNADSEKNRAATVREPLLREKTPLYQAGTKAEQQTVFEAAPVLSEQARRMHRLIGQVFGTYWLMEYQDKLYIVDQHAAHEKVLYEKLMKQYKEKTITSQLLFPAIVIEPGKGAAALLRSRLPVFESLGFEIGEFGGDAFKITAVPANLYTMDPKEVFTDILDQMKEVGEVPAESIAERLASMACKAAVKGNTTLSFAEADALFGELLGLKNPYHCPHGRPTIISMSRAELDKKFKRIV